MILARAQSHTTYMYARTHSICIREVSFAKSHTERPEYILNAIHPKTNLERRSARFCFFFSLFFFEGNVSKVISCGQETARRSTHFRGAGGRGRGQKVSLLARGESDVEKSSVAKPQTTHSAVICRPIRKYTTLLIRDSTDGAFVATVTTTRHGSILLRLR